MGKYELTSDGVAAFIAILYKMKIEKLQDEAVAFASDPRAYIAEKFALNVHQLEYLRDLKEDCVMTFGFSIASAMVTRRPIKIKEVDDSGTHSDKCFLLTSELSSHYDGKLASTGSIQITITV